MAPLGTLRITLPQIQRLVGELSGRASKYLGFDANYVGNWYRWGVASKARRGGGAPRPGGGLDDRLADVRSRLVAVSPEQQVADAAHLVRDAQVALDQTVHQARAAGVSWDRIGRAAAITSEGARRKWGTR